MCLIAFAWQTAGQPLVMLANRDEFHARPTRAAAFWDEEGQPDLLAGKDLEAGGTWMGVTRAGRFAALTNIRSPGARQGPRSRGELVTRYLADDQHPEAFLAQLKEQLDDYAGFNLLVGDREQLWHLNSRDGRCTALQPGVYGLSNDSLDSAWPKLEALRTRLASAPANADAELLLELLADSQRYPDDQLPHTGIDPDWERALSAAFIVGDTYGTRASTLLRIDQDGGIEFRERRFGPMGARLGDSTWAL
ncbi:NRDE family protein [Pseudomonas sp. OIL-1]|uniref:NRDE family protein n=1 Tax=Pseudomonas sp. OIL-1 TaxID=2706126 RepID=UPI0013A7535E|nr:NRDE family protein [Pseudomonas sp. OIL-1]QIB49776.1 NRDE family protein [Pseudomonas sp. OIL-1]